MVGNTAPHPKKISLFGYEIADWASLTALVISIGTLAWSLVDRYALGPEPKLIPPENIDFVCNKSQKNSHNCAEDSYVVIRASPVTFANLASPQHDYVVRTSSVKATVFSRGGEEIESFEMDWLYFTDMVFGGRSEKDAAMPFSVSGGDTVAKEIEFFPRRKVGEDLSPIFDARVNYNDFLKALANEDSTSIHLEFKAQTIFPDLEFSAACSVPIDHDVKADAARNSIKRISRGCKIAES